MKWIAVASLPLSTCLHLASPGAGAAVPAELELALEPTGQACDQLGATADELLAPVRNGEAFAEGEPGVLVEYAGAPGGGRLVITEWGLGDDSVRAVRGTYALERRAAGELVVADCSYAIACWLGRGNGGRCL